MVPTIRFCRFVRQMSLMILILQTKTSHPYPPASACSHTRVAAPEPTRLQQVPSDMAGCHLPHGTLRKQQSQLPTNCDIQSYIPLFFPFFSFIVTCYSLFLDLIVAQRLLISQSPPMGQCRLARKGMSQCLKAPVQSPKEPSIPTWAEYLGLYTFIQKYGLSTLCVA